MSKVLNDYFLCVFKQENMQAVSQSEHIYEEDEAGKLLSISLTKKIASKEIDRLNEFRAPGPD